MVLPEHRRIIPHFDISEQGLRELEIWLRDRFGLNTRTGLSGIFFDFNNQGGYLYIEANDTGPDDYGIHVFDHSGSPTLYNSEESLTIQGGTGGAYITVFDSASGITINPKTHGVLIDDTLAGVIKAANGLQFNTDTTISFAGTDFTIAASTDIDVGGNVVTNAADGVAATDLATVGQLPSPVSGIDFATANSGTYLEVTTTSTNGTHGMDFEAQAGKIIVNAQVGQLLLESGSAVVAQGAVGVELTSGNNNLIVNPTEVQINLDTGVPVNVYDSGGNPIFRVDENGDLHGKTGKALTFDL